MSFTGRIYDMSPILLQHIMVSLSGHQRNMTRYGKAYYEHRKFLVDFDTWSLDRKLNYQSQELQAFLRYVISNSRFYQEFYRNVDIDLIRTPADLKLLPILEKEMLRKNINEIVTIPRRNAVQGHTGGTTGKSLTVYNTIEDSMKRMAMLDHFKSRIGFENRLMRRATFNGKHIVAPAQKKKVFWRYNQACKQMIYSSFHLTEENLGFYVDSFNQFKPHAIDGFFTSITDLASYIERNGITIQFVPIGIFPTSETVTDSGRDLLKRVFNCGVYDQYASSEGAPFVTECKQGSLHIELASGVFEHLEKGNNEVLVTSFTTHGTPLIRYRIGDEMTFSEEQTSCDCGIKGPIVKEITGRSLDFLYTSEGAKINAGNVANLFKNMPNSLIRAQAIQENLNEITIKLEIDKNRHKREYDNLLKDEFLHKFGPNTRIIIEHVDEIPREKSGKFKLIKNSTEF